MYAIENAPDLFFRNVSTVKRGIYLDFNLSIQNSGSIDARNISFSVFSEDKLIHHDYIDNLTFGSGVSMRATNLRLKERNPDDIRFVIDSDNSISELDEGNNEAVVLL